MELNLCLEGSTCNAHGDLGALRWTQNYLKVLFNLIGSLETFQLVSKNSHIQSNVVLAVSICNIRSTGKNFVNVSFFALQSGELRFPPTLGLKCL